LQDSPALASGAVIAANAIAATNTAAGAPTVFKRSLIILPVFFQGVGSFEVLLNLGAEMGCERSKRYLDQSVLK